MNPIPFSPDDEPLVQSLRQLQPSSTPLDPALVFYRMGLEAGRKKRSRAVFPAAAALLLAASLSAAIVGPVGYRLGQASSGRREPSAPDRQAVPLSEPILAHSDRAPLTGLATSEPTDASLADASTTETLSPAPEMIAAATDRPTSPAPHVWPSFQDVLTNWLWGDALDRSSKGPGQALFLTRQLTAGRDAGDWFTDGTNSLRTGFTRDSNADSNPNRNTTQPSILTKPQEALRASDWKGIIESKHLLY